MPSLQYLPSDARRVILAVNPCAGARPREVLIARVRQALVDEGLEVELMSDCDQLLETTSDPLQAVEIRAVVAAGGDGTIGRVANFTAPGTPLAILPLGTENLLAKHLSAQADPQQLAATIARGATIAIDAGQAGDQIFTLMAGCGFDAEVVRRVHAQRGGGHIRHISYAKPILSAIRNYQYPELRVVCRDETGREVRLAACWVFVVNVPRYAGGLCISPDAVAHDGLLDVCTFKCGSLWKGLVYLSGVVRKRHHAMSDFTTVRASEVRIEADSEVPYQIDGDPGGSLPLVIKVLPGRLTLLVAEAWARRYGYAAEMAIQAHDE